MIIEGGVNQGVFETYLAQVLAPTLQTAIAEALSQITAEDARAFFRHCGYRVLSDLAQWFCSPL